MTETIERIVPTPRERVWELWTTASGIERWWAPDGFEVHVDELELVEGGRLVYTMTAVATPVVEFMEQNGMPLANRSLKTFTEIDEPTRLAYTSLVDFVPDHEPYEHLTTIELEETVEGARVRMTMDALHDEIWTDRLIEGRVNEIENLIRLAAHED